MYFVPFVFKYFKGGAFERLISCYSGAFETFFEKGVEISKSSNSQARLEGGGGGGGGGLGTLTFQIDCYISYTVLHTHALNKTET